MQCTVVRVEKWLDDILWESTSTSGTIFRAKGVLNIEHCSKRMILQVSPVTTFGIGSTEIVCSNSHVRYGNALESSIGCIKAGCIPTIEYLPVVRSSLRAVWLLQAVHELYEIVEGAEWENDGARFTKFVFIGKKLDEDGLRDRLASCSTRSERI